MEERIIIFNVYSSPYIRIPPVQFPDERASWGVNKDPRNSTGSKNMTIEFLSLHMLFSASIVAASTKVENMTKFFSPIF